jgi:hypothetical protein
MKPPGDSFEPNERFARHMPGWGRRVSAAIWDLRNPS